MSFSFSKTMRLRKKNDFLRVLKTKNRFLGNSINIDFFLNPCASNPRLGITVSTKYGNSPKRNLFKRRIRELFRKSVKDLPSNLEIVVFPHSPNLTLNDISMDFQVFCRKLLTK